MKKLLVIFIISIIGLTILFKVLNQKELHKRIINTPISTEKIKNIDEKNIENTNLRVLVIEFCPKISSKDNKKINELYDGGYSTHDIIYNTVDDLKVCSHGYINNIDIDWIDTNQFPPFREKINVIDTIDNLGNYTTKESNRLNENTWLALKSETGGVESPVTDVESLRRQFSDNTINVDYNQIIADYDLVNKKNNNEFDQVWIITCEAVGRANFVLNESCMFGKGAYWINGMQPNAETYECDIFPIIYANYERPDTFLHSMGHMSECCLAKVYHENAVINIGPYTDSTIDYNPSNWYIENEEDYEKITTLEKFIYCKYKAKDNSLNKYGVGAVHFGPNTIEQYQIYSLHDKVLSNWKDWRDNYPNLKGEWELTDESAWLNEPAPSGNQDAERLHMRWWFSLMPHVNGRDEKGYYHNWWKYITTLDFVTEIKAKNENIEIKIGEKDKKIEWICGYQSGKERNISGNEDIIIENAELIDILSDGTIVAKKEGNTRINIWRDGKVATININISKSENDNNENNQEPGGDNNNENNQEPGGDYNNENNQKPDEESNHNANYHNSNKENNNNQNNNKQAQNSTNRQNQQTLQQEERSQAKNDESKKPTEKVNDTTVKEGKLPKAGIKKKAIAFILTLLLGIIGAISYNKYKNIDK